MLDELATALAAARQGTIDSTALAARWRAALSGDTTLPPRYHAVAARVLTQLESSALFIDPDGGESCSFSQADLFASLDDWLVHARQVIGR